MMKKNKHTLTPKLRFPEFRNKPGWEQRPLGVLTDPITERVGNSDCIPYTITSGEGLISQEEKYGRTIAGKSLKNYYRLKRDDFAFNKSATKSFPQGYIARFQGDEHAAVPNSIFTCFRIANENVDAAYLNYLFQGNLHGRWLKDYITIGARAHGSLNISDYDLYALPIPLPADNETNAEQQKIAECLSSLDALITAEGRKLAALRDHKKGLMQQLFPQPGQSQPRLRFPEFRGDGEWTLGCLDDICSVSSGGTPSRSKSEYWDGKIPWITTTLIHFNTIVAANEYITEAGLTNSSARLLPKNTILMAMYGQGKTRGQVAILGIEAAINQACAALAINHGFDTNFVFQNLASRYEEIRNISNDGGRKNLSAALIRAIPISYPDTKTNEQRKIADCLTVLDAQIAAQAAKIEALKTHKRGLMQQLFPSPEVS